MAVEREDLYLTGKVFMKWIGPLALLMFAASVLFILKGKCHKTICQIIGAGWVVLPPLWFVYEYYCHFPKHGNPKAGYGQLKTSQDLASKVWASFLVVLAALYSDAFPK